MLASTSLQAWIGLAVVLCLMFQGANSKVFMGRFHGKTLRDHLSDQIDRKNGFFPSVRPATDPPDALCPDNVKKITVDYMKQSLDNFDKSNANVWYQHYQVNPQFYDGKSKSPNVFLLIGGEGPMSNKWVCFENYTYMGLASTHKAIVIQVEHRFFGSNKGLPDLTVENLKYLTTKQALADLYNFIDQYNQQNKFINPKWVVFGGSYPGTMAALFRKYYPGATQGAISSSSVFGPTINLWEYSTKMEQVIVETNKDVPYCYDAIKNAFQQLRDNMWTDDGRTTNSNDLGLTTTLNTNPINSNDLATVQFAIFDAFQGIFQYTYDGREFDTQIGQKLTANNLCQLMTDAGTPSLIRRLGNVYRLAHGDDATFDPSYQNMTSPWLNTDLDGNDGTRGWLWLQCNQFGWLQSTDTQGIFGNTVPIDYLTQMCSDLFDQRVNASTLRANIKNDAAGYFGQPYDFNGTNTVFAIGGFDPWSMLASNVSDAKRRVSNVVTRGGAHCCDMYASYPGEPTDLVQTRKVIADAVAYYISLDSTWAKTRSTTTGTTKASGSTTQSTVTTTKFSASHGLSSMLFILSAFVHFLN